MHSPKSVLIDAVVATAFMWINKHILGSHQNQLFVNFFLIFLNPNIFPDTDSYHCKCEKPANDSYWWWFWLGLWWWETCSFFCRCDEKIRKCVINLQIKNLLILNGYYSYIISYWGLPPHICPHSFLLLKLFPFPWHAP